MPRREVVEPGQDSCGQALHHLRCARCGNCQRRPIEGYGVHESLRVAREEVRTEIRHKALAVALRRRIVELRAGDEIGATTYRQRKYSSGQLMNIVNRAGHQGEIEARRPLPAAQGERESAADGFTARRGQ
jgi:hypothetical protein